MIPTRRTIKAQIWKSILHGTSRPASWLDWLLIAAVATIILSLFWR